jgi:hypothetical protein
MKDEAKRRGARPTLVAGLLFVLVFGLLAFVPLLLGRGSLNRFIVAFSIAGILLGWSFLLHGLWDWLGSGRREE